MSKSNGFEVWTRKGNANDHLCSFIIQSNQPCKVITRVSSHDQGKSGNLLGQQYFLPKLIRERGGIITSVHSFEWSGKGMQWLEKLSEVVRSAKSNGATIIAATTDRLIRNPFFRSNDKQRSKLQATEIDLRNLLAVADGVPLMTYLDPDATPEECTSLLTRWGCYVHQQTPEVIQKEIIVARAKEFTEVIGNRKIEKQILQEFGFTIGYNTIRTWLQK